MKKMREFKKILLIITLLVIFFDKGYSQQLGYINIELYIMNTGWFTYDSWQNTPDLWNVTVTHANANSATEPIEFRIYFELSRRGNRLLAGLTPIETVFFGQPMKIQNQIMHK